MFNIIGEINSAVGICADGFSEDEWRALNEI